MDVSVTQLPVYPHLDAIAEEFACSRLLLLAAEPGAGKTTLVPLRLMDHPALAHGKILLLEPRRIAARAAADRIASLRGEPVGRSVGLRTRHETVTGHSVRLEVVTEGVLLRMIQSDQSMEGCAAIIFDEFHERNLPAETGLALAWDCRAALREDLALLVMSATLHEKDFMAAFGEWPVVRVPGRSHPVTIEHRPPMGSEKLEEGAARLAMEALSCMGGDPGDVLVFLPGYREMKRAAEVLAVRAPAVKVEILHGRLAPEEQRRVLLGYDPAVRRIVLATNVAESSLTIPGVRAVADSGLERRVRFSPRTGMDHRDTARISADSATQRAGRAGRMGPGLCLRWWREDEKLDPHTPPEILHADLSPLALETAAWGARDARNLAWIDPPPEAHLARARALLSSLGLMDAGGRTTPEGLRVARMGLHPRLGRMVDAASRMGLVRTAALVAAILEEGEGPRTGSADFRDRIESWMAWERGSRGMAHNGSMRRIADEARRITGILANERAPLRAHDIDPSRAGALLLLAYPDRAARMTDAGGARPRYVTAGGRGASVTGHLGNDEFIVALELDGGATDARIYSAVPVDRADVEKTLVPLEERSEVSWKDWSPRIRTVVFAGGLPMGERRGTIAGEALGAAAMERLAALGIPALPWDEASSRFRARCAFIERRGIVSDWPGFTDEALLRECRTWLLPFAETGGGEVFTGALLLKALEARLARRLRAVLEKEAPSHVTLPSGTNRAVDYWSGDVPVIAARLQEFFGCRDTPVIGSEPALLHLLSPAGRPVQVTRDLAGFWERTYAQVRRELMGRYPKHYWPDDPMQAKPTARAKPRKK